MTDYNVKINFSDGVHNYDLPLVQSETGSNLAGRKDTIIEGIRSDGAIAVPAGKKSQRIIVRGILAETDGENDYKSITNLMNTMRLNVTTDVATLTLKHKEGVSWKSDWSYTVKRIGEIVFPESLRTSSQEYSIEFLVLVY